MQLSIVLKAILTGLLVSILIGPIFITLIELAIQKGRRIALVFASGIWVTDILYIYAVNIGLGYLSEDPSYRITFGVIGGVLISIFGLYSFFNKQHIKKPQLNIKDAISAFFKGAAINVFNPFVLMLWISLNAYLHSQEASNNDQIVFYAAMLFVVAILDVIKAFGAKKLATQLASEKLLFVRKVSGIALIIFGIILIIRVL